MGRTLLIALVWLAGCSAVPVAVRPDPDAGRQAWIDALAAADAPRVWAMIGAESRTRWTDRAEFEAWCKRHCSDLLVDAMSRTGDPVEVLTYGGGTELVLERGSWRVRRAALGDAESPLEAVRRFTASVRGTASSRLLSALEQALQRGESAIKVAGGKAEVALAGGGWVRLVKSGSGWRVDGWNSPK